MKSPKNPPKTVYTCNEYREEMVLLSLQLRLRNADLSEKEKGELRREIARLEKTTGL